jgi:hypothetical protein
VLILVKKIAILCHRWMGVAFCLLFLWWFVSGIFMMYWDYPAVSDADRLERAPFLDAAQVKLSAEEAWRKVDASDQAPGSIRLATLDGRPAYYFRTGRIGEIVYADTGERLDFFPQERNLRTAAVWTGQPASAAKVDEVTEPDQWTLEGGLRNLRPLWKYSWPNGEEVYVDGLSEVVQYTTRSSRFFAYLGPIPHWLYYTPLRKNGPLWSKVVIWLSGIATVAALMGLIVGLMMYSPSRRISIPYSGPKRLHHILGLFFGIVACTWAFSGMLSMEPFPLSSGRPQGGRSLAAALRGKRPQLSEYAAKAPQEALAQLGPAFQAKELELSSFASEPVYLATGARGEKRVIRMRGEPLESFDPKRILNVVMSTASVAEARLITQYDEYYLDRTGQRPLPVLFVQLNDAAHSRYYIDPKTAQVVGSYRLSTESWVNRWLYHGLHSVNFPWLYNYRPAWDIVVLTLMLGGTSLCLTSVIIGFQLVRRKWLVRRATGASP